LLTALGCGLDNPALIISSNPVDLRQCDLLACVHDGVLCEYGVTASLVSEFHSHHRKVANRTHRDSGGR
jgi:hypothetical protein